MQRDQHIERGLIAFFERHRRITGHDPLFAEILHDDQSGVGIGVMDYRRRHRPRAQGRRQRHIGNRVFGEMGDGAVGLAVAHRRTVRLRRCIHQHQGFFSERQPLENARRGVALHALALCCAVAGLVEKAAELADALGARGELAIAGVAHVAHVGAGLGGKREGDVEPVGRQITGGAVGPLDQHHGLVQQVVEPKFCQFGSARQPIEISMHQGKTRQIVILQQREGRARHLDGFVARQIADQRARERSLAGAEVAGQRHHIARLQGAGDVGGEPHCRLLVRQLHGKA